MSLLAKLEATARNVPPAMGAHNAKQWRKIAQDKINQGKGWNTVKITIDFENGISTTLLPGNLHLVNAGPAKIVLAYGCDNSQVPVCAWDGQLATPAEIAARAAVPAVPPGLIV